MVILQICLPEHGRMIDINSKQKVELHLDSDIKSHPNCVHGPTLLFSRFRLYFIAYSVVLLETFSFGPLSGVQRNFMLVLRSEIGKIVISTLNTVTN